MENGGNISLGYQKIFLKYGCTSELRLKRILDKITSQKKTVRKSHHLFRFLNN